tara:strand:- start:598 stop:1449 length:852 start_codon:yes stop_codon:yes gene_type:complete
VKQIIFVQDFFIEHITGGGELHDDVVIKHFKKNNLLFDKKRTVELSIKYLKNNLDKVFFISNFANLRNNLKAFLARNCEYLIYEHDYKFVDVRNPIFFDDFVVPKRNQVNINFYKMAKKVICLSKMHRNIFEKNLFLENLENINCSMWSDGDLELFKNLQNVVKKHKFAIINSSNPIKKTRESIEFCDKRGIEYDLISSPNYHEFIKKLAEYRGLVFMTGHPEPTPRVAIEAKMLNCSFLSQKKLISVAHEDYFDLKGINMIDKVRQMRDDALAKILGWINEV